MDLANRVRDVERPAANVDRVLSGPASIHADAGKDAWHDVDVNAWDDEIMEDVEDWEEVWDDENQVSYWLSNTTGEIRDAAHPPEMEVRKILDARAGGERHMTRRVQVRKGDGDLGTAQYNQHHKSEWEEIEQMRLEWRSSILIQKCWRMKSAILEKLQLRLERKSANICQRAGTSWRWRFHDKHFLTKQRAARKIQTCVPRANKSWRRSNDRRRLLLASRAPPVPWNKEPLRPVLPKIQRV